MPGRKLRQGSYHRRVQSREKPSIILSVIQYCDMMPQQYSGSIISVWDCRRLQREHLIYAQKISKPGKKNKGNSILGTGYGMQRQGLGPAGSENSKFTAASM